MVTDWHGVFAIMVTPFRSDLALDEIGLRANAEFLASSSVDVIVCLGSEGEFSTLTDGERRVVMEVVADQSRGRKPLVCGVSDASADQAAALARHASGCGADAVLATPPPEARGDDRVVGNYYRTIADAAGLPIFVYNAPERVGYNLSPTVIGSLAGIHGVVGVKQATGNFSELIQLCDRRPRADFVVLGGSEALMWPALSVGADGNTATAASAIPQVFADLWEASRSADCQPGQRLHAQLAPLRTAYRSAGGQAAVVKRLMDRIGLHGGPVRPPMPPATAQIDELLEQVMQNLQASPGVALRAAP